MTDGTDLTDDAADSGIMINHTPIPNFVIKNSEKEQLNQTLFVDS